MHVEHLFVEAAASNEHTPTILIITSVLGSIAGVWLLGATVQSWWRRTFGRRRDRYARLARLGAGAHLTFFVAVLGEPPAMQSSIVKEDYAEWLDSTDPDYDPHDESPQTRQVPKRFVVSTFIDRDYYVQTITDDDETVLAFSVTTRSRRFKPLYSYPKLPGRFERWRWEWRNKYPYPQTVQLRLGSSTFATSTRPTPTSSPGLTSELLWGRTITHTPRSNTARIRGAISRSYGPRVTPHDKAGLAEGWTSSTR